MRRITVWHNTHPDNLGYRSDHPMLRVFSYTTASAGPAEDELWRAVTLFNADEDMLSGDDWKIAAAYRFDHLRSFSRGDGFSVLEHGAGAEEFWISNGLALLRQPGPFPVLAVQAVRGSYLLGRRISYMIPALDRRVREGTFEIGGEGDVSPQQAIAVHHGLAPEDVVIISAPA
ncbi:hypothetical protein [Streptomyces nanshensis]|uniref:Uncharacterized protein n=1 Tax=Streptomyces nanshensis TaxID=518642 RepID=A0A1E7KZ69_9ACTN|nr:hypothetical protein [Streptomyces nanshensis]OEV09247.1 hypothetical protein AN218_22550 [Streptomyces nanshensis]